MKSSTFSLQQSGNTDSRSPRFKFRTSIPKLSLAMYPFSISLYEHVHQTFLM